MSNIITTIPKGRPDHISLDFDLLRAEGIQHLENLATEIWTDFNAHDPGITILELLCYALTDLGYRSRMLPIADLMASNDPSKKTWFAATEVLPNAPVTERDFRKLLIDVKGIKNAWLRKARPQEIVMKLYRLGWIFPSQMNGQYAWDEEKLRAFAKSQNIPFPEQIKRSDGTLTKGSAEAIAAYMRCMDEFLQSLESNPDLVVYANLINQVNEDIMVWDEGYLEQKAVLNGVKALEILELKQFFSSLDDHLTANQVSALVTNATYYMPLYQPGGAFPDLPSDLEALAGKFRSCNTSAYDNDEFDKVYESFQVKSLNKEISESGYTTNLDTASVLAGLVTLFTSPEFSKFELKEAELGTFFNDIIKTDLVANGYLLIDHPEEYLTKKINDNDDDDQPAKSDDPSIILNGDQIAAINTYTNDPILKKKITPEDKQVLIDFLDGNGAKHSDRYNRLPLVNLYQKDLPKKTGQLIPTWLDIEEAGYARWAESASFSFESFQAIVKQRLPERAALKGHWSALTTKYIKPGPEHELNLGYIAVGNFLNQAFGINQNDVAVSQILNEKPGGDKTCETMGSHLLKHLCEYGLNGLTLDAQKAHEYYPDPIPLNGIYQIILDLDDDINTANPKQVEAVVNRAMKRLHENRALCEDFLPPQVVEQRPVHFCIHLEVSPDADERKVMAEVIWRFQEYLTPTLRFRGFKEMHDLGIYCDNIYNGPLLDNGFLDDQEVDAAQLLIKYYHSDLVRIAMETPGVIGVLELKVKATPESKVANDEGLTFEESPVYPVYPEISSGWRSMPPPFLKRVIDICESCLFVTKGALLPIKLTEGALEEQLEWLKLTRNCEFCTEPGGHIPESGIYRPDLSDYRSIQYDLPAVYTVGDHHVLDSALPSRKAKARQLQAYLAFFDQILAAYLAQLGQVNRLLSIDQDTKAATRILLPLYEIPGVHELIEYQGIFTAKPEDWILTLADIPDAERNAVRTALGTLATTTTKFNGFFAFRQQLSTLLDAAQYTLAAPIFSNYFWEKYAADEANNYRTGLLADAESPAHRQQHRNLLLDHLLARFGESFGAYVHTLLAPDAEPEDNPWRQDFDGYLEDKARFLREVAMLSHDRGRGYNYRKMSPITHQPDVWLTDNVAGVKKRVSRLVGIDDYSQKSLIAEPPYRLDIIQSQSQQGTAQFRIVLKKRLEAALPDDNPIQAGPLMHSQRYTSKTKAQEKVTELYKNIWKKELFKTEAIDSTQNKWVVKFTLPDNQLISDPIGEEEAKGLLLLIKDLVQPGKDEVEGFHLVEHILLRPNDPKDILLQIPLGCDPKETPYDPYSFWITVVLPDWTSRFKHADFRYFFEQTFRAETPSHIAIRFCWVDLQTMYLFEDAFRKWLIEKAKCTPSECHVTDAANTLIHLLNTMPCTCHCVHDVPEDMCDECGTPNAHHGVR
ncbi:MAG: hypothetical protein H7246_21460 [Phycisphaerae bacterium]|nr:hypothetical protein [Saprospiraceae bacterium]